jgi:hypothetical protein
MGKSNDTLYNAFIKLIKNNKSIKENVEQEKYKYCFMLHDEGLNEIQKIEADDFFEWFKDGSFEKNDKLYISFLVKEF